MDETKISLPPPAEAAATDHEPVVENGHPPPRTAAKAARTSILLATEQDSPISDECNEELTNIYDTAQPEDDLPHGPKKRGRGSFPAEREARISEDGSFRPLHAAYLKPDGTYARPRGRAPAGMGWDAVRGVYVPQRGKRKHDSSNTKAGEGTVASADSNPYKKPRLPHGDTSRRNSVRGRRRSRSNSDILSSTGSFQTLASENDNVKNHYTRSKGSGSMSLKQEQGNHVQNGDRGLLSTERIGTSRSLNECATLLARVDREEHRRALVQDATSILEGFLFPMSFPWRHSIVPVFKNYPKDIDEIPSIAHAEDEEYTPFENGDFGYGGFEVGKDYRPLHHPPEEDKDNVEFQAATRRSDDAGVIELTVINHKSTIDESSRLRNPHQDFLDTEDEFLSNEAGEASPILGENGDTSEKRIPNGGHAEAGNFKSNEINPGETILKGFEHSHSVRKRKLAIAKAKTQRLHVSVRFGSVSSRSTVLHEPRAGEDYRAPLLCDATLPARRPGGSNEANPDKTVPKADRLKADQLVWTKVDPSGGYTSTITGNMFANAWHCKKPRVVQVGVRLNGQLLTHRQGDSWSPQSVRDNVFTTNEDFVDSAIEIACSGSSGSSRHVNPGMCTLDGDKLLERANAPQPHVVISGRTLPRLDCVPLALSSAAVRVVCSSPGKMKSICLRDLLRGANGRKCSVCWTEDGDVKECSKCHLLVHTFCCSHGGVMVPSNDRDVLAWQCPVCCENPKSPGSPRRRSTQLPARYQSDMLLGIDLHRKPHREESLKCSLCPHSGGVMSPGGEQTWAHDVCLLWTRQQADEPGSIMPKAMRLCSLCGSDDGGPLIKCAGSGCTVRFHPMCARITEIEEDNRQEELPKDSNERDGRLCSRFTLDVIQCGEDVVPIGYCGFHNPKRERTLYGCYPGGLGAATMRVPACETGLPDALVESDSIYLA